MQVISELPSQTEHPTSANIPANHYLADKHASALLIKLDKSPRPKPSSMSSDVWTCAQTQGRGHRLPPLKGQNQAEVRNKRAFHWSASRTSEKRGGNWKMPFKCSVMRVEPQTGFCQCDKSCNHSVGVYLCILVSVCTVYYFIILWAVSCLETTYVLMHFFLPKTIFD